jgi:hypothetical protein
VLELSAAHVGRRQVADASGVAESIIVKIANGDRLNIRARTERSILAVTKDAVADHALVAAGPTWKLLNELLATGYSKVRLARELGNDRALQIGRSQVTVRTAFEVKKLHKRLRRVPAKATLKRIAALRDEGYRPSRINAMAADLARLAGNPAPDLTVYGEWISAGAADLIEQLHANLTAEVA